MEVNSYITFGAAGAALVLLALGAWLVVRARRRRRATGPLEAIATVAVDSLRDILLPDGMGGQIYVEHILLTSRGIIVVEVKKFVGAVFASDQMDEWTVIGEGRRFGFPNPQGSLYDRVAAVRALLSSVPVHGHILFHDDADFSKGRPKHIILAGELERLYRRPSPDDLERLVDAYTPHWDKLKAVAEFAGATSS